MQSEITYNEPFEETAVFDSCAKYSRQFIFRLILAQQDQIVHFIFREQ